nr:MAG TPA: Tumor necrosis factor receptor superfamily, TWEAK, TNF Receptor, CRD [Caudoviricetes sp.]
MYHSDGEICIGNREQCMGCTVFRGEPSNDAACRHPVETHP